MQENLSTKKYSFSNLEKFFKNKKLIELNLFYNEFIKNYKKLNKKSLPENWKNKTNLSIITLHN